jgi:hypothetical protein
LSSSFVFLHALWPSPSSSISQVTAHREPNQSSPSPISRVTPFLQQCARDQSNN